MKFNLNSFIYNRQTRRKLKSATIQKVEKTQKNKCFFKHKCTKYMCTKIKVKLCLLLPPICFFLFGFGSINGDLIYIYYEVNLKDLSLKCFISVSD